jgi:hypothetical protein
MARKEVGIYGMPKKGMHMMNGHPMKNSDMPKRKKDDYSGMPPTKKKAKK